jgi:pyruvate dehydrogenase E2 component (dihydrolipoamide acetyltransferase)
MAKILDMPKLSPTMEEGVLSAWHKKEGDTIGVDDLLAEVETDKATMEFRAFDKGTLLKVLVTPGSLVKLGQAVAIVGKPGDDITALLAQVGGGASGVAAATVAPAVEAPKEKPQENPVAVSPAKPAPVAPVAPAAPAAAMTTTVAYAIGGGSVLDRTEREVPWVETLLNGRPLASPFIRKTARDRGIDLATVHGSGPGGRIVAADLETSGETSRGGAPFASAKGASSMQAVTANAAPEVRPLSMMRKTIARRLTESKQTVPHFYLTIDVDVADLVKLREQINGDLAGKASTKGAVAEKPLKISLNDLLIKACAIALRRVPECNAQFTSEAILLHKRVDISVAVAIADGLVTPVVRNADGLSVLQIAEAVRELAERARAKKLKPEEMQDGTFSISNLGMFGIDEFAAVINPPEGAILAVGQARDEAVVKNGQVVPGKRMAMTLSCDHRVVDGAVGAAFLAELRGLLEHPLRILTA